MLPDILKIVLVDDHPIVLEGLRSLINKQSNLNVEAAFTTGKRTTFLFIPIGNRHSTAGY